MTTEQKITSIRVSMRWRDIEQHEADFLLAELDAARAREAACAPYLKDGETPAECIARNRADADGVIELLRQARAREAKLREALSHLVRMVEGERDFCLGNWLPEEYEAVGAARAALAEGEDTPRPEVVEPPIQSVGQEPIKVVNLMEALRRSLDAVCPPVEDK